MLLISSVQNIVADLMEYSSSQRVFVGDLLVEVVLAVHLISILRAPTRNSPKHYNDPALSDGQRLA